MADRWVPIWARWVLAAFFAFLAVSDILGGIVQVTLESVLASAALFAILAAIAAASAIRPARVFPAAIRRPAYWRIVLYTLGLLLLGIALLEGAFTALIFGLWGALGPALPFAVGGVALLLWGRALRPVARDGPEPWGRTAGREGYEPGVGLPPPPSESDLLALYGEIWQAGTASFDAARRIEEELGWAFAVLWGVIAAAGLLLLFSPGIAPVTGLVFLAVGALMLASTWFAAERRARIERQLRSGTIPPASVLNEPPLVGLFRWLRRGAQTAERAGEDREAGVLPRAMAMVEFGRRMGRSARDAAKGVFALVFLVGCGATYFGLTTALLFLAGGPQFLGRDAGISLVATALVAALAFWLLHRMYESVEATDRRLDAAERALQDLERAFWVRF